MTRTAKLYILTAVAVVLAATYFLMGHTGVNNNSKAKETPMFDFERDDVAKVTWTYEGNTYTIEKSNGTWHNSEDEKFDLNQDYAEVMAQAFSTLSYTASVDGESPEQYGITDDSIKYFCTLTDGTQHNVAIGNATPITNETYVTVDDKPEVYTINTAFTACFGATMKDMFVNETVEPIENLNKIEITNADTTLELNLKEDGSWYCGDTLLNTDKVNEYITAFTKIKLLDCYNYSASDEEKEEMGFNSPQGKVSLSSDSEEIEFIYGKTAGSFVYFKLGGSNKIYYFDKSALHKLEATAESFIGEPEKE